jgi:D-tyrosyl-tRNA(Tyr) deacylase
MIGLVQRVSECRVSVDGRLVSSIDRGLLILLGVHRDDGERDLELLARKCLGLRIFSDDRGKMNLSIGEVGGEIMVVSQFTLFGDVRRGLRPFFGEAALPDKANEYYEKFMGMLSRSGIPVKGGVFGAHMHVEIHNDGPVTLSINTRNIE